jgi:glycosyltransferase involved in cell wall biosynthesis
MSRLTPTLAIIIPTRNAFPFLLETLNSLSNQSEWPDEIILSDNSSSDGSSNLLQSFARSKVNATYYKTDSFLDFGPSFNFAISKCNSDWFFCLHSDDILSFKAIENIRKEISKVDGSVGLISFRAELIREDSKLIRPAFSLGKKKYEYGNRFIIKNLDTSSINFGAVAINRKAFNDVGKFAVSNSYWLDLRFYHQLVSRYKIVRSPISLLRYRTFDRERNSDERVKVALENERFWKDVYLPQLITENSELASEIRDRQNHFVTSMKRGCNKLFATIHKYCLVSVVLLAIKIRVRLLFDRLGVGNFAKQTTNR